MELHFQDLIEWIQTLSPLSIYFIFAVIAYTENVIPPIPGDLMVAFGGYLAAELLISFTGLWAVTTVASVAGFMSMYAIGYYFGYQIDEYRQSFWLMKIIDVKYFDRGKRWMLRHGQLVILANRFLAGTRSVISLTAGLSKTKIYPTILNSTLSSVIWNGILLWIGWLVHENWQLIGHYLNLYGTVIFILIVVAIIARVIYVWNKNKKRMG